jgi:hypothetical protein
MRILKRYVIISLGVLLFSSSVAAQGGYMQQGGYLQQPQSNQGYYETEQPPMSEEATEPEESYEPVAYSSNDDNKPSTFGVLVGYAIDFESLPYKPYEFGFGLRGGYTLDIGLYLGMKFVYFTGEMYYMDHENVVTLGAEVGFDIDADVIIVRPSIDVGLDARGGEHEERFHLAPGATLVAPFEDSYFVGLDVRYQVVFDADPIQGISFLATGGVRY